MNSNIFMSSLLLVSFSMATSLRCYNNFDGFKDGKLSVADKYSTPACSPAVKKMCIKGECDGIMFYSCTDTDDICKAYLSGCKSCTATPCTEDLCNYPNADKNNGNQNKPADEGEKPKEQKLDAPANGEKAKEQNSADEKKPKNQRPANGEKANKEQKSDGEKPEEKKPEEKKVADAPTDGADTAPLRAMMLAIGLISALMVAGGMLI